MKQIPSGQTLVSLQYEVLRLLDLRHHPPLGFVVGPTPHSQSSTRGMQTILDTLHSIRKRVDGGPHTKQEESAHKFGQLLGTYLERFPFDKQLEIFTGFCAQMMAVPQEPMPSSPATVPATTTPIPTIIAPAMYSQPRVHPSAGDIAAAGSSSRASNTVAVQQARDAPVTTTAARVPETASRIPVTSSFLAYQNMHQLSHDPVPTTTLA